MPAAFSPETGLVTEVGAAAADCLARAVLVGVLAAESVAGVPTYRDLLPGAFGEEGTVNVLVYLSTGAHAGSLDKPRTLWKGSYG